ncbi:DNA repair protein RecO [Chelatococcus asaccharovorans]|uniref:DNA repair protein RecO n=1 Tax=Chelatococcus asaccharovorans TaxID=28210 RepID=A0A2V3U661_9HYPH|nr:DNA repair protein RecO [Chelatococcus asaccharovorans]MBS7703823.1 DNA repair protein RecO [Chelatococcus asaccharovorans]PXW57984.1 DNA replication and repair protein RecO [Chelatococcus asaccharovorans]CAH1668490.1 DNA repair protein RecO [Chelatococcus asaccharovorans]CAH1680072.1 DNA repair protein RecO [Chelatococcus asaccharovorans]
MQWQDEGIIIGVKRHGEGSVILELMTKGHGRHLGLVRGGRSPRQQATLQAGNRVDAVWRARIEEQLGTYAVEAVTLNTARFLGVSVALYGLASAAALLRLLPERDPHPGLFEALGVLVDHLDDTSIAPALLVRFELAMLAELGFGLDLGACAATGATAELVYVSPKSGRAVSAAAGAPFHGRLLALPAFLRDDRSYDHPTSAEVVAGFALTGYFLRRHVFMPRGLAWPDARDLFVAQIRD